MKQKTSIIWRLDKDKFKQLVLSNNCYKHILDFLGLSNKGNNFKTLKKRILEEGIDDSHIRSYINSNLNHKNIPLNDILIENSTYSNTGSLKLRLIKSGLLQNKCYICGLMPEWNGKYLTLVLDHKNGFHIDNRIENLRLLCPNCNSQTDTFCGRRKKEKIYKCIICGKPLQGYGKTGMCHSCLLKNTSIIYKRKFNVDKNELEILVNNNPVISVAKKFNVSGNAIKKRCKLLNIPVHPRGYWTKKLYNKL
jgi:hypothetical protein